MKTTKQLERYFKGTSNHWRIAVLLLVQKRAGLTLDDIAQELKANPKTISEHTRVLVRSGLLNKTYMGRQVEHTLSPYGKRFAAFIKTFQ